MVIKVVSIVALSLLFACGSDDNSKEAKTERVSTDTLYHVDEEKIQLPEGMELRGLNSGCSYSLPQTLSFSLLGTISYNSTSGVVSANRKQLKANPHDALLTGSSAIDGDYTVELENGSALLRFDAGHLSVTLTCRY